MSCFFFYISDYFSYALYFLWLILDIIKCFVRTYVYSFPSPIFCFCLFYYFLQFPLTLYNSNSTFHLLVLYCFICARLFPPMKFRIHNKLMDLLLIGKSHTSIGTFKFLKCLNILFLFRRQVHYLFHLFYAKH